MHIYIHVPLQIKAVYPVTNQVCKKMNEFIRKQIRIAPKDGVNGKDVSGLRTIDYTYICSADRTVYIAPFLSLTNRSAFALPRKWSQIAFWA